MSPQITPQWEFRTTDRYKILGLNHHVVDLPVGQELPRFGELALVDGNMYSVVQAQRLQSLNARNLSLVLRPL